MCKFDLRGMKNLRLHTNWEALKPFKLNYLLHNIQI